MLAPWFFRNIMAKNGGPISDILAKEIDFPNGKKWEAYAFLKPELAEPVPTIFYGDAHGCGTSSSQSEAIYRAISEALERWAYFATHTSPQRSSYGFQINDSTTGMAAYPGITSTKARRIAVLETTERWAIDQWWHGNLNHKPLSTNHSNAIEILTPIHDICVVITWESLPSGLFSYGFSAGSTPTLALQKATVEQNRNARILRNQSKMRVGKIENRNEERFWFFSNSEGFDIFQERVSRMGIKENILANPPRLIIDTEINGPWKKYARVWRALLEGTDEWNDKSNLKIFSF